MNIPEEERDHANQLRRRAEDALRGNLVDLEGLPTEDIQYVLHELQVHQVELTLQNEELRRVQLEFEAARDLYSDLYNFAPAGYCTLDRKDHILEANQTLADLLGVGREGLIRKKLSNFVDRADQDEYYLHHRRAFDNHQNQVSKICMVKPAGDKIVVRLESTIAPEDGTRLRVMLSDITEQQRIEKEASEAAVLRELRRRVTEQREQERQQIARDLHDGPIQDIIAMSFAMHGMLSDHPTSELVPQLHAFQASLKNLIGVLRSYSMELRPPTLWVFGLETTIHSHAAIFQEKHPTIRVNLETNQTGQVLPEATSLALFRIYQEALTNILKHVQATDTQVWIRLDLDDHLVRLQIQDNGPGFDLPEQWNDLIVQGHLGLIGMRERAELVGGQLEIYSKLGEGTRVVVTVPLEKSIAQSSPSQSRPDPV